MAAVHHQYTREMHDAFGGYWATWLPGVSLQLGCVGTFENRIFVPRSHLRSFGVKFDVYSDGNRDKFQYASANAVSISFKGKGKSNPSFEHVGEVDAGVAIRFSRENAVVFSLLGCREDRIADQRALAETLVALPKTNWPQEYAFVTHLVRADSGTILISSSQQSRIEISAEVTLGGLEGLARLDAGLAVAHIRDMQTQFIACVGLTPLFRAVRVKKPLFRPKRIQSLGPVRSIGDVVVSVNLEGEAMTS